MDRLPAARWLGPQFQQQVVQDPRLLEAYKLSDYEAPAGFTSTAQLRAGGEVFAHMRASQQGLKIEPVEGVNPDLATAEALRLRLYKIEGKSARQAYEGIASRYGG